MSSLHLLTILFTFIFKYAKARALEIINTTTVPPVIWPTVESGLLLLRPRNCTTSLDNCSFHGECALHGTRPVCLCALGYHGHFCEIKTTIVPPWHVATLLLSILAVYIIIHAGCVIHRSRCQRLRSKSYDYARKRTELSSYGSIGEATVFHDDPKRASANNTDETQTTTPTGTLSR